MKPIIVLTAIGSQRRRVGHKSEKESVGAARSVPEAVFSRANVRTPAGTGSTERIALCKELSWKSPVITDAVPGRQLKQKLEFE
jgi:hypothetical protein